VFNLTRIDRGKDVSIDCKNAPQEKTRLKLVYMCIRMLENLNDLPKCADIVSKQDTRMWVISRMTNITFSALSVLSGVWRIKHLSER
jgi:hypothetical protein